MNKTRTIFVCLIFYGLLYVQIGSPASGRQTETEPQKQDSLIVSDKHLDFSQFKVTFIELGADKCIPCKAMQPVMREIAKEFKGTIQVVFYDVWKTPDFAKEYGVKMIPTQIFVNTEGEEIFRHVGFFAKEDIVGMLKEKNIL